MNKNLKKVISAVAALAMSASSFVALAANYPDVDASASYKQAVDELSSLNVIEGYEDGTFQPDKLVTRAEFAKMVITTLGSSELAQATAAAGRDTQFSDVTGSHWAAGYVTAAVSQSIINGFEDKTFRPDENVTYAQAMKMLVCAAGYEQWSIDQGGWPDGYMYWGNQLKVGSGVKDVTDTTEISRAQVAQMIDNIINAPVCVNTHNYEYDQYGNRYPTLVQRDGTGQGFESIITRNHDTYKVRGVVTKTNRSDKDAVNVDEVTFTIQNAKRWLDKSVAITKDNAVTIKAKIGDTNVADYLKQYVEIMVREDDADEYTILSVASAGQTEEETIAADDYDAEKTTNNGTVAPTAQGKMYFYSNGKSSTYRINNKTELYVNGVKYDNFDSGVNSFIKDNTASDVTFIDVPEGGSTDGFYDLVLVNVYETAILDTVENADGDKPELVFMDSTKGSGKIVIDTTDRKKTYSIKDAEGNAMELEDLEQYDVLSIQYDVTERTFSESKFFDITVSRATEEGKYTTYDSQEKEYEINDEVYAAIDALVDTLDPAVTYTLYLDAFGRIAYTEEVADNKKIAILDALYTVRGSDHEATLILKDGSREDYILKESDPVSGQTLSEELKNASSIIFGNNTFTNSGKVPAENRVVEYTVNSSNELTIKSVLTGTQVTAGSIFNASKNTLGGYRLSEDTTSILNIAEAKDIQSMAYSSLVDEKEYDAYVFDRSRTDKVYRFVLIKSGSGAFSKDTQLAVFNKSVSTQNDSGDAVTAFNMFVNGESQNLVVETGKENSFALSTGDLVIYETNNKGEIDNVVKVANSVNFGSYANVRAAALAGTDSVVTLVDANNDGNIDNLSTADHDVKVVFGPITGRSTNSIEISAIDATGQSSTVNFKDYSYADDVKIYEIDYNEKLRNAISVGSASSVSKTNIPRPAYVTVNEATGAKSDTLYTWDYKNTDGTNAQINPNFAFVRVMDNDAQEIYVIKPATEN